MDPLSALKMVGAPNLTAQLADPTQGSGATKTIPMAELQQLVPGMKLSATGGTSMADFPSFQNILSGISPNTPNASVGGANSMGNTLGALVQEVSDKQTAAQQTVSGLLGGQNVSLHQAMISVEEASVSFQLMVEVRNRLLDSYQELMRMQI